jgi:putative SOS response-associated peptidase YedK
LRWGLVPYWAKDIKLAFAIITTTPNELCAELHDRMLLVLGPETWAAWLGEEPADPRQLMALLVPFPSAGMTCWRSALASAASGTMIRA